MNSRWARVPSCIALALVGVLILPRHVHAYIDPGTGSMAYQAALSLLLGVGFVARQWIGRGLSACRRFLSKSEANPASDVHPSSKA